MRFGRKVAAAALAMLLAANGTAVPADGSYYFRMNHGGHAGSAPALPDGRLFGISISGPAAAVRGESYSVSTTVRNAEGPVSFEVLSGALPDGIALDASTGGIGGSTSAGGSFSAVIMATDSVAGKTATAMFAVTIVDPFSVSASPAGSAAAGEPYVAVFSVAGGGQPYSLSSSPLPAGLSFSSAATTGTVSGTPSAAGSFSISVTARESHGLTASHAYSLIVTPAVVPAQPLAFGAAPPSSAQVGAAYGFTYGASGGTGSLAYSLAAGALPSGIDLGASTGTIAGVPGAAGTFAGIRIRVADSAGATLVSDPFSIVVQPEPVQPVAVTRSVPGPVLEGTDFSMAFSGSGGRPPLAYSLAAGAAVPGGIVLDPVSGVFSGRPAAGSAGTYAALVVVATDAEGTTGQAAPFDLHVYGPLSVALSGTPAASVAQNTAYSALFASTGGYGSVSFAAAGSLPDGASIDPVSGLLSASFAHYGSFSGIAVRATDSLGHVAVSAPLSVVVVPRLLVTITDPVPLGTIGMPYAGLQVSASGGSGSFTYALGNLNADLPLGMALDRSTGLVSGTPTEYYQRDLNLIVTDTAGNSATSPNFTLRVTGPPVLSGTPASSATLGIFYKSTGVRLAGGTAPFTYQVTGSALPSSLAVLPDGSVQGVPTATGMFAGIRIQVTDSTGATAATEAFSIEVVEPEVAPDTVNVTWNTAFPLRYAVGAPMMISTFSYTDSGELGPFRYYENPAYPLPEGMYVDEYDGVVLGSASRTGVFPVSVMAVYQPTQQVGYSDPGNVVITTISVEPVEGAYTARFGQPVTLPLETHGGTGTVTYSLASGTLPPGLGISSGQISGVPTQTGVYPVTVRVVDGVGARDESSQIQISVYPEQGACYDTGVIGPGAEIGQGVMGVSFTARFPGTGLPMPPESVGYRINWTGAGHADGGSGAPLPPGTSFSETSGIVQEYPSMTGTYGPIVVSVVDAGGLCQPASSPAFVIESRESVHLDTVAMPAASRGVPYSAALSASLGKPGYWFAIGRDEQLPAGLSLDGATGAISGTATVAGSYGFYATVTDAWGFSHQSSQQIVLQVN